ncbi:MAG: cation-transporting P-type ATPase, partial [Candidatus Anstonellaceae archaeon]
MMKTSQNQNEEILFPWAKEIEEIYEILKSRREGLTEHEARKKQKIY